MWLTHRSERVSIAEAEALAKRLKEDTSGRFRNIWIHDDDDGFSQVMYQSFFFRVWSLKCKGKAIYSVFLPKWGYGVRREFIFYPFINERFR